MLLDETISPGTTKESTFCMLTLHLRVQEWGGQLVRAGVEQLHGRQHSATTMGLHDLNTIRIINCEQRNDNIGFNFLFDSA
jgi:hypothetical protein